MLLMETVFHINDSKIAEAKKLGNNDKSFQVIIVIGELVHAIFQSKEDFCSLIIANRFYECWVSMFLI